MSVDYSKIELRQLLPVMEAVIMGNNQSIQQATKFLKIYVKTKESIKLLTFVLVNNQNPGLRQLSAVLLKRNLINLFSNLQAEQQEQFKKVLLIQFHKETSLVVQKSIAQLIGLLLPVVELKNWQDLQSLFETTLVQTPNSIATLVLLNNLLYHFNPPPQILEYLVKSVEVDNLTQYALKCILAVVQNQESFNEGLPAALIQAWDKKKWGEDIAFNCLEIFSAMAQKKGKLSLQLIKWICQHIITSNKFSDKLRCAGLDFIHTVIEFQQKLLFNNQAFFKEIVAMLCLVCSEPPRKQQQNQQQVLQDVALWLLETFSVTFKPKKIYPILFEAVVALINSNQIFKMNTAYLVLGAISEGCRDKLRKDLREPIMSVLIPKGLQNPAPEVKGAAINALCYFSQFLIPEIIDFHSTIIPSMMGYINDLSIKVAQKALIALDIFFDNMEADQITKYLPIITPKLVEVVANTNSTVFMKRAALSGIGSLISAAELQFQPYVELIYKIIVQILKIAPSPQLNTIRAEGINVLGKLTNVFCKEESPIKAEFFKNGILPILETVYEILVKEIDPEVREFCFSFFYLLANAIKADFEFIFDKIIIEVINACNMDTDTTKNKKQQFSLDSNSDDQKQDLTGVQNTYLDQKAAAIHALGQFAKACSVKFLPYFQAAYQILEDNHQFKYDNIRIQVVNCYQNLTLALIQSKNEGKIPEHRHGLPCTQRYPPELQTHFNTQLLPRLLFLMTEDDSSQVASCAIEALDKLINAIGPVLIDKDLDNITNAVIKLLQGSENFIQSEDEEQQEQEDTDAYIFEPLCDLIPTLSKSLRDGFKPYFNQMFPDIMKYAGQRQQLNDNTQIIGVLSQIFKYSPSCIPGSINEVYPRLIQLKFLNDEELNRNICYCLGIMFQNASKEMEVLLNQGLLTLKQVFEISIALPTKENAVAAICRIIYTYNPKMPIQLFIQNVIKMMPFTGDQTEERTILKTLIFLSETNGAVLRPHLKQICSIIEHDIKQAKKYKIKQPFLTNLSKFYTNLQSLLI